jgi:hypothetical protein
MFLEININLINYYSYEKEKIALQYQIDTGIVKMDMACNDHDPQRNIFRAYPGKKKRKTIQVIGEALESISGSIFLLQFLPTSPFL